MQKQQQSTDRKRNQLSVKSPVAGTVIYLLPKQGEYISHGTVVAKIGKTGRTRVNVDVLSDSMGQVALGQQVTVSSPVLSSPVTGIISTIYPQAFEKISTLGVNQRRVRVIADLPEWGSLKSGYEVRVSILSQSKQDALLIPRQALSLSPQGGLRGLARNGKPGGTPQSRGRAEKPTPRGNFERTRTAGPGGHHQQDRFER